MPQRQFHIDAAKVLASHLIVVHHFTVYGPLAQALDLAAPKLTDWFFDYARMAVQVFLVIGGYLGAGSLAPHGYLQRSRPWRTVAQRYVRLVLPFGAALLLVMACSALTRLWLTADFIPEAPSLLGWLAHLALLSDILGFAPLSIGIWYVAIDFQLFALLAVLLWLGGRSAQGLVALAMLASLFFFNLQADGDSWAPYFLGSYGMGAFAWWAGHARHGGKGLALLAAAGTAALLWDFRLRIALALAVAIGLGLARRHMAHAAPAPAHRPVWAKALRVLGRSSYALFLTHFAVLMLANALWARHAWTFAAAAPLLALGAWACCVVLALLFERHVERPLSAIQIQS